MCPGAMCPPSPAADKRSVYDRYGKAGLTAGGGGGGGGGE